MLRSFAAAAPVLFLIVACGGQEPAAKVPPAPATPKDPPALTPIAQACARVSACTRAHDGPRFRDPGACVDWWLSESEPTEPLRRCLAKATGCDEVSAC